MKALVIMLQIILFLGIVAFWLAKKIYFWLGVVPYSIGWFLVLSALTLYLGGIFVLNQPIELFDVEVFSAGLFAAIFILKMWNEVDKRRGRNEEQSDAMRTEALGFVIYPGLQMGEFYRGIGELTAALAIYYINGACLGLLFPPYSYEPLSEIGKVLLAIGLWMLLLRFSGGQRGKLWEKLRAMTFVRRAQPRPVPV